MKLKLLSRIRLLATPWTAAYQAPLSMGFSRQEYWSGVPSPAPTVNAGTLLFSILITVVCVGSGFGKTVLYVCTYLLALMRALKLK